MIFRPEHPKPQWERPQWRNLNGEWEFDFDFGASARARELYKADSLPKKIIVPFCPESELSGIGYKDFIAGVCYRKVIELSAEECAKNIFLHFGAVDFRSFIYINGQLAGKHLGGYASFAVDITPYVREGENVIFVIAEDDIKSNEQPAGKQSQKYESFGCFYTRTTGIWQTVWLEFVAKDYIKSARYYPDAKNGRLTVMGQVCGTGVLTVKASYEGKPMAEASVEVDNADFLVQLNLAEIFLWEPGHGRLYDLELTFGEDLVNSYFGLRDVYLKGKKFMVNGKCVFLRTVLDQGFYPEGIYTAKSDEELKRDIELSMAAGFNGARLHEKVFEQRFIYHCDKAGYMIWGEHGNWGMDYLDAVAVENFACEWMEVVERDFNSPAIIGWCPVNETWGYYETRTRHRFLETLYKITKIADKTRPCIAVSGNYHIDDMEIFDVHDYNAPYDVFKNGYAHIHEGIIIDQIARNEGYYQTYKGQPIYVSEYGGFGCAVEEGGWSYRNGPKNQEELVQYYADYTNVLLDNPDIMGMCYTQLYDVEQEQNGLYTYYREPKMDITKIKAVNERHAAIED